LAIAFSDTGTFAIEGRLAPASCRREDFVPRFHFNIYDGVSMLDREGMELTDWHEARLEAIRRAGEILKQDADRIALGEDWHMEVTDDTGLVLFRLDFTVMDTAATRRGR
jgi:hypothetical protein